MTDFDACAARALDTASARGAAYADVRFEEDRAERIEVRNGSVATLTDRTSAGYGVRALFDGAWGFAARADTSDAGIDRTAARAVEIARAGAAIASRRFGEAPQDRYVDTFATPYERDAASVPLGERVALLLDAERALHAAPSIRAGRAWIDLWHTGKVFYSTTGSRIEQSLLQTGSGMS
ncbi:MAG: hypothetical protein IAI48_11815, partial [Candidatus Eremiobacteraeota bacterium]|nr:hypothetical protein [Candidatus Eremiobacteraeota bacterium]